MAAASQHGLLLGGIGALVDQALDLSLLPQYWAADQMWYFAISSGAIVASSLATAVEAKKEKMRFVLLRSLPGMGIVWSAYEAAVNDERESEEKFYEVARTIEVVMEAMPQALLQSFVALRDPEGVDFRALYASLATSLFSMAWQQIAYRRMFGRRQDDPRYVRVAVPFRACEVVSRVMTLSTLAYSTDGRVVGALIVMEVIYWLCRVGFGFSAVAFCGSTILCNDDYTYREYLKTRIVTLVAYVAAFLAFRNEDAPLTTAPVTFALAIAALATVGWMLLMPRYVTTYGDLSGDRDEPAWYLCGRPSEEEEEDDDDQDEDPDGQNVEGEG